MEPLKRIAKLQRLLLRASSRTKSLRLRAGKLDTAAQKAWSVHRMSEELETKLARELTDLRTGIARGDSE